MLSTPQNPDLNPAFKQALDLMEKSKHNVFITGPAGTGKSTLLTYFREHTKKNVVVLAPTGVAAVNIKGQTIHSFFHFKPDVTVQKAKRVRVTEQDKQMYQRLETIVIDEVSMVRADLIDCVDTFLRLHGPRFDMPFGGVQMIFIGDLFQLPPVTKGDEEQIFREHYQSPYFFSAHVFQDKQRSLLSGEDPSSLKFVELNKIYRQKDADFIKLLGNVRNNVATHTDFATLNSRLNAAFDPSPEEMYIYLTTTNAMADEINERKLAQLGADSFFFRADIHGKVDEKNMPTFEELEIKIGAQVMMLCNDLAGRWINGTMAKVVDVQDGGEGEPRAIMIELENGDVEPVTPHRWNIYQFTFTEDTGAIDSVEIGSFTQYPMRLAWAVTIHKSQGKTFEKVIIDIGRGTFSSGQLYVALSRATTLKGIVLKRPVAQHHIWLDKRLEEFIQEISGVPF